ncbi:hypothetical protein MMC21_008045 [Puttea exsequens]|nr:hypothetical protein [Puttea exsequens]
MTLRPTVRVTAFFNKKPGMTDQDFQYYYTHVHARHLLQKMHKYGIISYTQQFSSPPACAALTKAMGKPAPIMAYDVMGSIVFPSWDAVEAWFRDEENIQHQADDGPRFADYTDLRFVVGEEWVCFEGGEAKI